MRDAAAGGAQVGTTVTNTAVAVSNGFFVVTLDFGTSAFDGNARWLEVAVRKGTDDFTVLSPRLNTNWIVVGTLATNTPCLLTSNKLTIEALSAWSRSETNVTYAIGRQE